MTIAKGTHSIGPRDGKIVLNVYKEGMAAMMGHDLTFEVRSWSGTADLNPEDPGSCSISVNIDVNSFEIVDARGGAKALSGGDRQDIQKNIEKTINSGRFNTITYKSSGFSGTGTRGTLQGNLTVAGQTKPISLAVEADDSGKVKATTSFAQSQFGIKPYSKFGVLKVKDDVDITIELQLPTA